MFSLGIWLWRLISLYLQRLNEVFHDEHINHRTFLVNPNIFKNISSFLLSLWMIWSHESKLSWMKSNFTATLISPSKMWLKPFWPIGFMSLEHLTRGWVFRSPGTSIVNVLNSPSTWCEVIPICRLRVWLPSLASSPKRHSSSSSRKSWMTRLEPIWKRTPDKKTLTRVAKVFCIGNGVFIHLRPRWHCGGCPTFDHHQMSLKIA